MASLWLPEDDFRLRKSIENGASLESLAKGAIKFSRKFTLSELTNRWHSLLYNPQIKSLSSSVGFELGYSDQFLPQTHHHYTTPVRSHYYTACKRRRLEELLNKDDNYDNYAIDEDFNHVAFGGHVFDGSEFFDLQFDASEFAIIQNTFPEIMHDDGDDLMVDQFVNFNDGQIQDCNVTDTTTMFQEGFQDPLFQQSFNETTSVPHQPVVHDDQEEPWIDPESYPELSTYLEEYCPSPKPLREWDPHPEIVNGVINCTLNTESDEIPDNSHVDFEAYRQKLRNSMNPSSSSSSSQRKHMKPPLHPNRRSKQEQDKGKDKIYSYGIGDCAVTEQASCSSSVTTSTSQQHSPEKDVCEQTLSVGMDISTPMSEDDENVYEIESDEDLPSYSDVEAMVLDMDLEPVGQDMYALEASKYRNQELARMIMRLEQSSKSHMNRNIASHKAFAILYGSSKHYINKPEMLLGRATGEYPVDINLGKSWSGKKVSRRQALIRLKQDGCFEIKNLGKFWIWINEKEIGHGEVVNLKNNSLIQIRDMSFIFEMNEKEVKRYLDGIHK